MKQSSICWLAAFVVLPITFLTMLWLSPLSSRGSLSGEFLGIGGVNAFVVMCLTFFCITVLIGYFLKSIILEDILFVNDQYFLQNKNSSAIKAVKIETCNSERKYYVYGSTSEAPTIFSYYSEGFIRGTWSCAKTPEGQILIAISLSLFLTHCIITHFGNESLSYLQFYGVTFLYIYLYLFIFCILTKKYTVSNNGKKNRHMLKCKNNLYKKNNLCYIIKKDSLEKYEEKFNIKENLFHIIENNGDYILYYKRK